MLLSARMLNNVNDVNNFEVVQTLEMVKGDVAVIYLALIDASTEKHRDPTGRRYCAATGSTLKVVIQDINTAVTLTKYATRPFAADQSIWKVTLDLVMDAVAIAGLCGTYALKLTLVEPGTTMPATWLIGTTYGLDVLTTYSGGLWRSLQVGNTGNQPDISPIWWVQMNVTPAKYYSGFVSQAVSIARTSQEF